MAPLLYSKAVTANMIPAVTKNAPKAPTCPAKLETKETKLEIQYRKGKKNQCGVIFKKEFVEHKITTEIESFSLNEYHVALEKAAKYFREIMALCFPDSKTYLVGSYGAGVDIHCSDLDFVVTVPSLASERPVAQLYNMKKELKYHFSEVWVQSAAVPVLQLKIEDSDVSIDVTIDSGVSKRNTQLLSWYGQMDARVQPLSRATKAWASKAGVEGAKYGRCNSFSIMLMVILYLQVQGVLPNIQELFPELNGEFLVEDDRYIDRNLKKEAAKRGFKFGKNKSSLAALFLGFLKFYADFDFSANWVSIRHGKVMTKRWDEEKKPMDGLPARNRYIVVADPFLEVPRNCAGTVDQANYVERIQLEFREEYERCLQSGTIFSMGPGNWIRVLIKEGKTRDMQRMVEQRIQQAQEDAVAEWGNVPDDLEFKEKRPEPWEYWEEESRRKKEYPERTYWPKRDERPTWYP